MARTRTLHPQARDLHRAAPVFWNRAAATIPGWPRTRLARVSFRKPSSRVRWDDLPVSFREDAEAYIALRAGPDIFDERPNIPTRPLAERTLRQQREHIRLAASVLIASGVPSATLVSISVLVQPERSRRSCAPTAPRREDGPARSPSTSRRPCSRWPLPPHASAELLLN